MLHNLVNNNNDSILILAYLQKMPFISHTTHQIVSDIGGEVDLDCSYKHSREFNVLWIKVIKNQIDASIVLSSGNKLIVKDPRVSLVTEIKKDTSRYIIHVTSYEKKI